MVVTKRGLSPEAKGYRATLKALNKTESPIHREGAEKMRAERLKSEAPESAEARAGKERLAELVEHGDVDTDTIARLAIYLDCEPWEALSRLETSSDELSRWIDFHRQHADELVDLQDVNSTPWNGLQANIYRALLESDDLDTFTRWPFNPLLKIGLKDVNRADTTVLVEDTERLRISQVSLGLVKFNNDKPLFLCAENLTRYSTEKVPWSIVGHRSVVQADLLRRDLWTMGRELAMLLPEQFGYKDAKEADRMITKQVERIGQFVGQDFKKIDGAFYVGPKTEKQEKLRKLDKKVAQKIVVEYKQAIAEIAEKKAVQEKEENKREKEFKMRMQRHLVHLQAINQEIDPVQLPATVERLTVSSWFNQTMEKLATIMSSKVRERKQLADDESMKLLADRQEILISLSKLNDAWRDSGRTSIYDDAPKLMQYQNGLDKVRAGGLEYWSRLAEETAIAAVDEYLARDKESDDLLRDKLDELKGK